MRRCAVGLLAVVLLQGCGGMPWGREDTGAPVRPPMEEPSDSVFVPLSDPAAVRAALLAQHEAWKGVPYRMGGTDRRGMDCSGFAQMTFMQRFGVVLPRDTGSQRQAGMALRPADVAPGDLLFFDTGRRERHVGIYVGELQFLHVSTRAGVMLSSLKEGYWARRYTGAVRVPAS